MSKLKALSGTETVKIFERFGFAVIDQKGSHVKLRKVNDNLKQTLTIPIHAELDKGTLKAIYRQALQYIPETELRTFFYSE